MPKPKEDLDKKAQALVSIEAVLDQCDPLSLYHFRGKHYGEYHTVSGDIYKNCYNMGEIAVAFYIFKRFHDGIDSKSFLLLAAAHKIHNIINRYKKC